MSYTHRLRSDLTRALAGHPYKDALLNNLEIALNAEKHEGYTLGQLDATKPAVLPENPTEWREQVEYMKLSGCNVTLSIGRFGFACAITDPDRTLGVNRRGESIEEAVAKAFAEWEATRPEVVA